MKLKHHVVNLRWDRSMKPTFQADYTIHFPTLEAGHRSVVQESSLENHSQPNLQSQPGPLQESEHLVGVDEHSKPWLESKDGSDHNLDELAASDRRNVLSARTHRLVRTIPIHYQKAASLDHNNCPARLLFHVASASHFPLQLGYQQRRVREQYLAHRVCFATHEQLSRLAHPSRPHQISGISGLRYLCLCCCSLAWRWRMERI